MDQLKIPMIDRKATETRKAFDQYQISENKVAELAFSDSRSHQITHHYMPLRSPWQVHYQFFIYFCNAYHYRTKMYRDCSSHAFVVLRFWFLSVIAWDIRQMWLKCPKATRTSYCRENLMAVWKRLTFSHKCSCMTGSGIIEVLKVTFKDISVSSCIVLCHVNHIFLF